MPSRRQACAFSLLEVVIAVAIFASGVAVLVALLPSTLQRSADSVDTLTALRLPDSIKAELQHIGGSDLMGNVGSRLAPPGGSTDLKLRLVAARSGDDVRELGSETPTPRDRYFLVELYQFSSGQLAYNPSSAFLAINVRVSWPYQVLAPDALTGVVPLENRSQVTFNVALNR